jgi:hypothetical protein
MYGFDLKPEPRRRSKPRAKSSMIHPKTMPPRRMTDRQPKGSVPRRVVYAMPRPVLVRPVKGTARRMKRGRVLR